MHVMFKSLDIDAAVKHVKNIIDNIGCSVCDKADGTRLRYHCGHTSCEDCVVVAPDCSFCLTPPKSASREPVADEPLTQRTENAIKLLNVFQNEFHIDVYKRKRISEQLKVEKEVFPECIQAPAKYFNKRKSFRNTKSNKENRLSQLPGEEISFISDHKMEQPSGNVELWLSKYVRKPFADLNSNDERLRMGSNNIKKQQNVIDMENAPTIKSTRKRSHFKSALSVVKRQSLIDKHLTPVKKKQYHKKPRVENNSNVKSATSKYCKTGTNIKTTNNDESGIVINNEAVIVIDDSQSVRVDKDMNAWLAVQEAEKKKQYDTASIISSKSKELIPPDDIEKTIEANIKHITKVPFYLMGYFSEKCSECKESNHAEADIYMTGPNNDTSDMEPTKDVSITVENKSFTAIIKLKRIENIKNKVNSMQSVEVQTDITDSVIDNKTEQDINLDHDKEFVNQMSPMNNNTNIIVCESPSQDLFRGEDKILENMKNTRCKETNLKSSNKTHNVIIEESDSDGELGASISLEVTADIHRSCEEIDYGILADIDNLEQHRKRPRRAARGFTPTSTDSSDKENYNPNRKKKAPSSKKKPVKK